jgi:hypothetical protein
MRGVRLWAVCLALVASWGCGDQGPRRYELSGSVRYDGQPVPAGTIVFEPAEGDVTRDTMAHAEIRNGQYKTLPGMGVIGGPHVVYINGSDGVAGEEAPLGAPLFPETYSTRIDLPKADGTHDFDIPLMKRGAR